MYCPKLSLLLMLFSLPVVPAAAVSALAPTEVRERMAADRAPALIDLRSGAAFREVHVGGAMNMPVRGFDPRRVPSSRSLVFYADGLGRVDARAAASEAAEATGREDVYWMRGGMAAWESAGLPTTRKGGFAAAPVPAITYGNLLETRGQAVLLLDVRETGGTSGSDVGTFGLAAEDSGGGNTDLAKLFPDARIKRPGKSSGNKEGTFGLASDSGNENLKAAAKAELTVVIDDGDGSGAELVRSLRASGNRRVVLLAGGETILQHEGKPGLGRQSSGAYVIDTRETETGGGGDE